MSTLIPFGLGTFATADGVTFAGLVVHEKVHDLGSVLGAQTTTLSLLEQWDAALPKLRELAQAPGDDGTPLAELRPLPPVQPRQLLCAGANYFQHVREIAVSFRKNSGDERPDEEIRAEAEETTRRRHEVEDPFVFAGLTSAICGARDDIILWGPGEQHDWELELAVVIGRYARDVRREEAIEYVAGYTIGNDISTRDVMYRPGFPMTDFLMTKSRPTFFPTGPYIVPRKLVPDPRALRIRLAVNGEVMQDESVDDIIYGVEDLVSYASTVAQLLPGDLLLTGSPAGNAGRHGNRWLRPGDVIEGEITGLGRQRNLCVAPPAEVGWRRATLLA
ncbi:MAG: fumarylacetoacetate hydrolase family protein [Solirubrobacterales bacterium]|nr:fumarylacetoacetate hydrolase family protein [Solirubrobacterales bacterium]MBV9715884.1 fumarylacetoacetate hydrolase family protein [Solirubrobacterales bacterium]